MLTSDGIDWTSAAAAGGGYALSFNTNSSGNPGDSATYFLNMNGALTTSLASGPSLQKLVIPKTGTLEICYGITRVGGTLATTENSTLAIRLNNTTDTTITSTLKFNVAGGTFNNTSLGISVTAGDYIEFKLSTPVWATNPTLTGIGLTVFIT